MPTKRILVLGATGHFGGRICRRLASRDEAELIVTSRQRGTAQALAGRLRSSVPGSSVQAAALDPSSGGFRSRLAELEPSVVIHTAGPYQGQDYRVAQACIDTGCHYVDLADGRSFVNGIDALHDQALNRGVLVASGASTLPAVSGAVVDELRPRFNRLEAVEMSIAPAHRTPRGAATVASVLSYCGKPFEMLHEGTWRTVYGWQGLKLQSYPRLGRRLSGVCDVPDLALLPARVAGVRSVSFHAALEAPWEQLGLWLMAAAGRTGWIKDWTKWVRALGYLSARLGALGSDRGGMQVRLSGEGTDGGETVCTWDLTAGNNHGPEIPCTPSIIVAGKLIRDELAARGARPCLGMMSLGEILDEMSRFSIHTEITTAP